MAEALKQGPGQYQQIEQRVAERPVAPTLAQQGINKHLADRPLVYRVLLRPGRRPSEIIIGSAPDPIIRVPTLAQQGIPAKHLAELKAIYERDHPEAKAAVGSALIAKRWDTAENSSAVSFAEDAARQVGLTSRSVRQSIRRATEIAPRVGRDRRCSETTELDP
jgi:hypothetical protein